MENNGNTIKIFDQIILNIFEDTNMKLAGW
jgi:hypothetical protein